MQLPVLPSVMTSDEGKSQNLALSQRESEHIRLYRELEPDDRALLDKLIFSLAEKAREGRQWLYDSQKQE